MRLAETMAMARDGWLSVSETARRLGVSRRKVGRMLDEMLLGYAQVQGQRLVRESTLDAYLAANYRPPRQDLPRAVRTQEGDGR